MKAEILVGVSGSGKTTYAMTMDEYAVICRDDIRFGSVVSASSGWKGYKFTKENEDKVTRLHTAQIDRCAELGQNLIIADTNLSKKNRRKMIKYLQELGYVVEIVLINLPLKACIERDTFRGNRSVGEDIIRKQWDMLQQNINFIEEEKKLFGIRVKMFNNCGGYEESYV